MSVNERLESDPFELAWDEEREPSELELDMERVDADSSFS